MDQLITMRWFADVVQTGSFSQTARHYGVSASTINRQVSALERELGARLINRTTRQHSLTEAGRLYAGHVQRVLAELENAQQAMNSLTSEPRGTLTVTAPVSFGRLHVAPALTGFASTHPHIQIALTLTDQVVALVDEATDVAVRIAHLPDSTLIARKVLTMNRLFCASPDYLRTHGIPDHPAELTHHQCLTFQRQAHTDRLTVPSKIWSFTSRQSDNQTTAGPLRIPVSGWLRSNNGESLVAAATSGAGIVLVPRWLVQEELATGKLVAVLTDWQAAPEAVDNAVYLVFASPRQLSPKIRAFVDYFAAHLARTCS